jgi:hypothetical protein
MKHSTQSPHADSSPGAVLFIVTSVQFLTPFMSSSVGIALPVIGHGACGHYFFPGQTIQSC